MLDFVPTGARHRALAAARLASASALGVRPRHACRRHRERHAANGTQGPGAWQAIEDAEALQSFIAVLRRLTAAWLICDQTKFLER